MMRVARSMIALLPAFAAPSLAIAAEFHVTVTGTAAGDGSEAMPWDLPTALAHPAAVQPGDVIWLHGGTYVIDGNVTATLTGTEEAPIIVRQAAGEHATIDMGSDAGNAIAIMGGYTWYWGFEVTSSSDDRWAPAWLPDNQIPPARGQNLALYDAPGTKLINLVTHDTASAIGFWVGAIDAEIYGCLIYFNGFDASDRGHGHAIYVQNQNGTKRIRDNIMFGQYSYGVHGYTEGGFIDNLDIEGNISFSNGMVSTISDGTTNILVGGAQIAHLPRVASNATWFDPGEGGMSINLGYGDVENATVVDNVAVGPGGALGVTDIGTSTIMGNVVYGPLSGFDAAAFPDNEWYTDTAPTGTMVIVRPNAYDPDRAHVAVYNWDDVPTVDADLSALLVEGDGFELRDAQDYYGEPVAVGTYDGVSIAIPMTTTSTAAVIGEPATPYLHTSAQFGAFVLLRTEAGPDPTGDPTDGDTTAGQADGSGEASASASADASASAGDAGTTSVGDSGSRGDTDGAGADDSSSGCGCRSAGLGARTWPVWLALPLLTRRRTRGRRTP
jgi:hypothetical protein